MRTMKTAKPPEIFTGIMGIRYEKGDGGSVKSIGSYITEFQKQFWHMQLERFFSEEIQGSPAGSCQMSRRQSGLLSLSGRTVWSSAFQQSLARTAVIVHGALLPAAIYGENRSPSTIKVMKQFWTRRIDNGASPHLEIQLNIYPEDRLLRMISWGGGSFPRFSEF